MLSCRGPPFHFRSWESTLAWVACGLDPLECASPDRGVRISYFPDVARAAANHSAVHNYTRASGDGDLLHAFSFCFWATLAQGLPWAFLALLLVYTAVAALRVPLACITAGVQFLMQALSFSHAD